MIKNKNPTVLCSADDIFKCFCDENGYILVDESCDPNLIQLLNNFKTIDNKFKLVKKDKICPKCGSKLHCHDTDDFMLNNTIPMVKSVYKCSDSECGCYTRPLWNEYIDSNCNYTKSMMNMGLELSLIENISYGKQSEIINLFTGVKIPRSLIFEYSKNNFDEFVDKHNKIIEEAILNENIEFSDTVCYDEQYVRENDVWVYKMMALDPDTKYIYDFNVVREDDFNLESIVNFLKPIVDEHNIKVMSADAAKVNKKVVEELNLEFDLCAFHEMANFMKLIRRPMNALKKKINSEKDNIEDRNDKIEDIEKSREGKYGRTKKDDKKAKKLVADKQKYERENRESRSKIRKYKEELKSFTDAKKAVSTCILSKTYKGGINRYNKMINNLDKFHEKTHSRIKNMKGRLDSLLMHTKYKSAPTTNNPIELAHRHTIDGREKRKFKTIEGIERTMELEKIRWNKRCVLGWV